MKLIIQIRCYNEAEMLAVAVSELPCSVPGFDSVEWLVIVDGSSGDTARIAREHGMDHAGTDADNQYNAGDIPALVAPIVAAGTDIVVGARPIETIEHFSSVKRLPQKLGSWVVRITSGTDIPDAPSGLRAISRTAAQRLMVFNDYT